LRDIVEYYSKFVKILPLLFAFSAPVYCLTVKYFGSPIHNFYFLRRNPPALVKFLRICQGRVPVFFSPMFGSFLKGGKAIRTIIKWAGKKRTAQKKRQLRLRQIYILRKLHPS